MTHEELLALIDKGAREKWKGLSLSRNQLTTLPAEIGRLTNLTLLHLWENQLKLLPPEIGRLINLTWLELSKNQLTTLPAEIGCLTNLTDLDLGENRLTTLPAEIGCLINLTWLELGGNQLTALPAEIGCLTRLTKLNFWGSKLTALPAEIGCLTRLTKLELRGNQLTALPAEIGCLTRLTELNFWGSKLTALPAEIGNLTSLTWLELGGNQLTALPGEIGCLTNLTNLGLSKNKLTRLPVELGQLQKMKYMGLDGNPLTFPPPEIVQQGTEAVLTFLRAQQKQGTAHLWHSKMVVVGEGGVGKTSLLKVLRGQPFNEKEPTTHGMHSDLPLKLPHPERPGLKMKLLTWDFGGQQIYHATHQFFLTDKALSVLVWNGRLGHAQCRLEYWLDTIKARAPDSPILIVATHRDERAAHAPPLKEWQKKYRIIGHYEVSSKTGIGIEELKAALAQAAASLPLMGQECPRNWLAAIKDLQEVKVLAPARDARDYFHRKEALALLQKHGIEGQEAAVMLQWYHDLGGILIYPADPELKDLVLLNPRWVSEVISRVLDHEDTDLSRGLFTRALRDRLWHDLPEELRGPFVRLMERFDLSYRIPESDGDSLVVARLPADPPPYESRWNDIKKNNPCHELTLRYRFNTIPAGIPTWFIAREHRFSTGLHWRNGALLRDGKHLALVRCVPGENLVELAVRGPFPQNFFALLMNGLDLTLDRFPGLEVRRLVPCPLCSKHEFDYEVLLQRLENKATIECPVKSREVSIRKLLSGWGPEQDAGIYSLYEDLKSTLEKGFTHQESAAKQRHEEQLSKMNDMLELLQRDFAVSLREIQGREDSACPSVFVLRPVSRGWLRDLFTQAMELELFCEAPGCWHPTAEGGRYTIKEPARWLKPVIPYLRGLIKILRFATPAVGPWLGSTDTAAYKETFKESIECMNELARHLPEERKMPADAGTGRMEGAALRVLRQLLEEVDRSRYWGGLKKVFTPEGHYLWLCPYHATEYDR